MLIAPRISNHVGEQIAHTTIEDFKALKSKATSDEPTEKKESSEDSVSIPNPVADSSKSDHDSIRQNDNQKSYIENRELYVMPDFYEPEAKTRSYLFKSTSGDSNTTTIYDCYYTNIFSIPLEINKTTDDGSARPRITISKLSTAIQTRNTQLMSRQRERFAQVIRFMLQTADII